MSEPRDIRELVGADVADEELARLRRVDSVLRSIPGPPEVPASLTRAVGRIPGSRRRPRARGRTLAAVALAAALAALAFGLGARLGGDEFEERAAVAMRATEHARGANAVLRVGRADEDGNWPLRLEVSGLPRLPEGGYYSLWLAKDGAYGAPCGSFRIGEGETEAEWTVSYALDGYDAWVVTAYRPNEPRDAERPWLLMADVRL